MFGTNARLFIAIKLVALLCFQVFGLVQYVIKNTDRISDSTKEELTETVIRAKNRKLHRGAKGQQKAL